MYKNHIDLIGFIGSDPEARQTSNGTAVTTFSLATKSSWKNDTACTGRLVSSACFPERRRLLDEMRLTPRSLPLPINASRS